MRTRRAVAALVALTLSATACLELEQPVVAPTPNDPPPVTPPPPPPSDPPPPDPVRIDVGESIQAAVDVHPPGTAFLLAAGVHREQMVFPRDGQRFTGEPGAVLSGARELPDELWEGRDGRWVVTDVEVEGFAHGEIDGGNERARHPEDLFSGSQRLVHVRSLDELDRSGEWFFDYEADEVWVASDPAGEEPFELAVTEFAFVGPGVRDVVIENLTVERYANWAQRGAINGRDGIDWVVRFVEARQNHGLGIGIGPGMRLEHSRIVFNGQLGVGGVGRLAEEHTPEGVERDRPVLVIANEIAANRQLPFDWSWEGGGTKFVRTTDSRFVNNWAHGNEGPGMWWDIDNADALICANLVEDNVTGIFYEISYGAEIVGNEIRGNRREPERGTGAAAFISSSSDVWFHHNVGEDQALGVRAVQVAREDGDRGRHSIGGLRVEDNVLSYDAWSGVDVRDGSTFEPGVDVVFTGNRYGRTDGGPPRFFWIDDELDLRGWQALGFAGEAALTPDAPAIVTDAPRYEPAHYGPVDELPVPEATADVATCVRSG